MSGILTLIPTPIDEENPLEEKARFLLTKAATVEKEKSIFVIEELKVGRKRWLNFSLPREVINDFFLLNEHNANEQSKKLIEELINGKNVFLMSDGGLPAFCDPGRELVGLCHCHGIKVTSTPFCNSVILALALSGFSHESFVFEGFLPVKEKRDQALKRLAQEKRTIILMDTPYRLKKLLDELNTYTPRREIFLALDLNSPQEELHQGLPARIAEKMNDFKREFIIILSREN